MKKTLVMAALLGAFSLPQLASAQTPAAHTVTGNMTLASEYIFRGIGQTNRHAAIQGGFDYAHKSGLYAGVWASNISTFSDANSLVSAPIELDIYGGYKGEVRGIGYDVGILQYYYPGTYPANYVSPNTLEVYGAASWKWLTLKYSHAVSNLFGYADSHGSNYLDLTGNYDLGHGITLSAHVGHQKVKNVTDASYTDWKIGVSKEFSGIAVGLAYVDTDAKGGIGQPYYNSHGKDLGKSRALLTIGKTF